ncbi:MAG: sialidase family protein [Acidobacteriota bacterium]
MRKYWTLILLLLLATVSVNFNPADKTARNDKPDSRKTRLLAPDVFDHLSAAGKRAALLANGQGISPQSRDEREGDGTEALDPIYGEMDPFRYKTPKEISTVRRIKYQSEKKDRPRKRLPVQRVTAALLASSTNFRVNDPAMDESGHTQSESSIAVNQSNIVVSFNDASENGSGYAFSTNGGASFTHRRIPAPADGVTLGDGVVAFGPEGEIYYATLALTDLTRTRGFGKSIIGVAKSTDQGATFSIPVDASTDLANDDDFQDKEWLAVDRGAGSRFKGNVYVSWTDFSSSGIFIAFSRSTNGGRSFKTPVNLSRSGLTQGSMPAVAPNGDIYVAYFFTGGGETGIAVVKSTDGGASFSAPQRIAFFRELTQVTGIYNVRANSFPSITVDKNNFVHVVYCAPPGFLGPDRSDIFYLRSTDGGASFSAPRKLNDDATTTTQLLPAVAATDEGTIGVKWWDRRNDPLNDSLTDVYMTISADGGASFKKNFRLTDHNWAFGPSEFGSYHGDYDGLAAQGDTFFASWSDERGSDPDVYFTTVPSGVDALAADFNISSTSLYESVVAGNSTSLDFSTTAMNGFSGSVALSASPDIEGITYNFADADVAAGQSAALTVTTTANARPGVYLITVSAERGDKVRRTNLWLNVFDTDYPAAAVPANISRLPGYTFLREPPQIDSAGTIHLAFYDDTEEGPQGFAVYYSQSTDGGRTYSRPARISPGGAISALPVLKVDPSGTIYIFWRYEKRELRGNALAIVRRSVFFSKSTDGGKTFSTPVDILANSQSLATLAGFEILPDTSLVVFYLESGSGSPLLRAVRSTNGGDSFSSPTTISANGQNPILPRSAVSKDGDIAVVYVDDLSFSESALVATRSTDGGRSFSAPAEISGSSDFLTDPPAVAFDSTGVVYVAYNAWTARLIAANFLELSDPKARLTVAANGRNFSAPQTLAPISLLSPHLTIDRNDTAYVAFTALSSTSFNFEILLVRSCDNGKSFGAPMNVSSTAGSSSAPFTAIDSRGRVNIAWAEFDGLNQEIFFARSTDGGITFGPSVNVSNNVGVSSPRFIGVNRDDELFFAWNDDSPANLEVIAALLSPADDPAPAPDFALVAGEPSAIRRGKKGRLVVNISRVGGFAGAVTVSLAEALPAGIKLTSPQQQATLCSSAGFNVKLKKSVARGLYNIALTGRDETGRVRNATVTFEVTR